MKDTSKRYCRILLDVLESHGVKTAVVSPGSRNAPLLIGLDARKEIKKYVVCDEREAAFMALGMSMVSGEPVMLVCTSGTALYNYAPAVAEAYYKKIPLIVISADRPLEWIDQNDSQTLQQPGALSEITKSSFDIPVETGSADMEWYVNRIVNEAFNISIDSNPGPVHINIRIAQPISEVQDIDKGSVRLIQTIPSYPSLHPNSIDELARKLADKRILVVGGFMRPDAALNKYLVRFADLNNIAIAAETLSNIHLSDDIYSIDTVLAGLPEADKRRLAPDIVIAIGGAPISGMLKDFIRNFSEAEIWTLADTDLKVDCFRRLSLHIQVSPASFFRAMTHKIKKFQKNIQSPSSLYSGIWRDYRRAQRDIRRAFVEKIDWSELKAFSYILENIPHHWNLFLSNGTCVRYGQLFTDRIPHAVYANRGVSGIEGTTATALGCAVAYPHSTLLISGDMSFSYSQNIWGNRYFPHRLKIVIINNNGGGIFRFISPTRYIDCRDEYFCSDPHVPVNGLAQAYGVSYYCVRSEKDLEEQWNGFLNSPDKAVMEIMADTEYSASILRKYMRLFNAKMLEKYNR